ncbi:MAG: hypothetical protein PHN56_04455 [Candidatus Nanoarchaeia archaeon]|nr:hypothetical protein [Candidatus Nanoarchaeia archaeon]
MELNNLNDNLEDLVEFNESSLKFLKNFAFLIKRGYINNVYIGKYFGGGCTEHCFNFYDSSKEEMFDNYSSLKKFIEKNNELNGLKDEWNILPPSEKKIYRLENVFYAIEKKNLSEIQLIAGTNIEEALSLEKSNIFYAKDLDIQVKIINMLMSFVPENIKKNNLKEINKKLK